jgi:predicted kinase
MTDARPTLHLLCGKIAAGKSTLAKRLAAAPGTLLISEDHWARYLFKDELKTLDDYRVYSARLRAAMGPHVVAVLKAGLSVVLDFPANTAESRRWMRAIADEAGCADVMHVLDPPDEVCKARLRARNASGEHPFQTSDADFDAFSRYFVRPTADEGFSIVVHAD